MQLHLTKNSPMKSLQRSFARLVLIGVASMALLAACGGGDELPEPITATVTATVAAYETLPGADTENFEPVGFDLRFSIPLENVKIESLRVFGPLGEVSGSARGLADGKTIFVEISAPLYSHAEYRIELNGVRRDDGVPIKLNALAPVRVPTREMLALGSSHACVLRTSGRVRCWGRGAQGELGNGSPQTVGDEVAEMGDALIDVDLGTDAGGQQLRAVELVAGLSHNCARLESGDVKCWGDNSRGQLGLGRDASSVGAAPNEMGNKLAPVKLGTGRKAVFLAAGWRHTCAGLDNGQLKCWGSNEHGELGAGVSKSSLGLNPNEMGDQLRAVNLGSGRVAIHVSASAHTCAALEQGDVKCWGGNEAGQLGQGDLIDRGLLASHMGDSLPRVDLGAGSRAQRVVAGGQHTCAILTTGVSCWGRNDKGALGVGDLLSRGGGPGQMGDSLPRVDIVQSSPVLGLAAGQDLTCAKLDQQRLFCWGDGADGQLGLDSTEARGGLPEHVSLAGRKPVLLPKGEQINSFAISPSGKQVCARLNLDGRYRCWGSNSSHVVMPSAPGVSFKDNIGDAPGEMATLRPIELGVTVQ
jgi:alpha-tubulin suppressor-like RCC1 family protein